MTYVDLYFRVVGDAVPLDHGFHLYSAICKATEQNGAESWLHAATSVGLIPIRGIPGPDHLLLLDRNARFGLRLPAIDLPKALLLAGRRLRVAEKTIRAGVTTVEPLNPAPALYARIVTTRNGDDTARFDTEIARQLASLEVQGNVHRGNQRIVRIHDKKVVGHELLVTDLSPEDSITLQQHGLGGRRKMGCGVFFVHRRGPVVEEST